MDQLPCSGLKAWSAARTLIVSVAVMSAFNGAYMELTTPCHYPPTPQALPVD